MAILHVIDAARIAHETVRGYYAKQGATHPTLTATWGDLPQDQRDKEVGMTQRIIDKNFEAAIEGVDDIRVAVVEAMRPFVEE